MSLDTLIFDPTPCGFPKPRIPLLPTGHDGIAFKTTPPWAPATHFRHFTRGRYALREAYRLAGIGPGSTLLAPAYHCRTMLDPALALDSNVLLYPMQPDLTPDFSAIEALTLTTSTPVKALLATHFFGIPKDFSSLAAWSRAQNITFVEDCSHALFCENHRPAGIGCFGQFVVSSPYKFLPSPDGGLLYSCDAKLLTSISQRTPSWYDEFRGISHARFRAVEQHRSRTTLNPARLDDELASISVRTPSNAIDLHELVGLSADYQTDHEGCAGLRFSRTIYRHPDIDTITRRRREHYHLWVEATMNLPYCRPLYPELTDGCIPYMFPLLIEHPDPHFNWLKLLGVPIFRWDSIVASDCPTAIRYRLHLLHLPCHQSLASTELDWMITALHKVGAATMTRN